MSDEIKLQSETTRAIKAQELLDNDLLKEAFAGLEQDYTKALFETHIDAVAAREKLFLAVNVVRKVRDHLTAIISDGKLAAHQLKALAEAAERQKTWPEVRH